MGKPSAQLPFFGRAGRREMFVRPVVFALAGEPATSPRKTFLPPLQFSTPFSALQDESNLARDSRNEFGINPNTKNFTE
jgi:hypothetical protein